MKRGDRFAECLAVVVDELFYGNVQRKLENEFHQVFTIDADTGNQCRIHPDRADDEVPALLVGTEFVRETTTHTVYKGERIQDTIDAANPGDTIRVMPGVYCETLKLTTDNITIIGVEQGGERPTLDGENRRDYSIEHNSRRAFVQGFHTRNFRKGLMCSDSETAEWSSDTVPQDDGMVSMRRDDLELMMSFFNACGDVDDEDRSAYYRCEAALNPPEAQDDDRPAAIIELERQADD